MTSSASGTYSESSEYVRHRRCGGGVKSRWSAWEIAAMVAGFVVFWPLGLLALFLKWKNGEMWRGAADAKAPWDGMKKPDFSAWQRQRSYGFSDTGNAAFDDYKREALKRLDEERRKLDDEQRAFRDFLDKLRHAKDKDEFDRFMSEHKCATPPPSASL